MEEINDQIKSKLNELKVEDIFEISFIDEEDGGALMDIGFTELGDKAMGDLMKRNPKITEKDIEEYIKGVASNLLVMLSEKVKKDTDEQPVS